MLRLEANNLTFVEREELDKLKETNAELKRQQDLLEQSKKLAQNDVNKEFVATMKKDVDDSSEYQYFSAEQTAHKTLSLGSFFRNFAANWIGGRIQGDERSYIE